MDKRITINDLIAHHYEELSPQLKVAADHVMGHLDDVASRSLRAVASGSKLNPPTYSRLAKAGAARIVKDSDSLSSALSQLTAPDQVAAMAHAGWETVSEGAEVSDQIISLAQTLLDEKESQ